MEGQLTKAQSELLKESIEGLPFSTEFKALMQTLRITTLEQLSKHRIEELEELEGFNTVLIHEYGGFMIKNNLGELIDP